QHDIVTAFLESEIQELIYLQLPKDFRISQEGKIVLKQSQNGTLESKDKKSNVIVQLKRSLYGLKQAGCNWYNTLGTHLEETMGMKSSKLEAGIYITKSGVTIIVWVDDMLLIGTKVEVEWMKSAINERFKIKDLGDVKFFLSMLVERDKEKHQIYLSQGAYLKKVLERFGIEKCERCTTPMDSKNKLKS